MKVPALGLRPLPIFGLGSLHCLILRFCVDDGHWGFISFSLSPRTPASTPAACAAAAVASSGRCRRWVRASPRAGGGETGGGGGGGRRRRRRLREDAGSSEALHFLGLSATDGHRHPSWRRGNWGFHSTTPAPPRCTHRHLRTAADTTPWSSWGAWRWPSSPRAPHASYPIIWEVAPDGERSWWPQRGMPDSSWIQCPAKKPIDQHYFQEIMSSAFALQCISPTSSPALQLIKSNWRYFYAGWSFPVKPKTKVNGM